MYRDEVVNINVTVLDEGTEDESVTLNIYANATLIDTTVLPLNGTGSFENRSFTYEIAWNTAGFAEGNYTVSATASAVPGEIDTADNTLIGGTVHVRIPGDIDGDDDVDYDDFLVFAAAYLKTGGQPGYDQRADFDGDGDVDYDDFLTFAANYPTAA